MPAARQILGTNDPLRSSAEKNVCCSSGSAGWLAPTKLKNHPIRRLPFFACRRKLTGTGTQPLPEKGLPGGVVFEAPPFKAIAANITPDPQTGIGKWTDAQPALAIREGVRPDKSLIGPPSAMKRACCTWKTAVSAAKSSKVHGA